MHAEYAKAHVSGQRGVPNSAEKHLCVHICSLSCSFVTMLCVLVVRALLHSGFNFYDLDVDEGLGCYRFEVQSFDDPSWPPTG